MIFSGLLMLVEAGCGGGGGGGGESDDGCGGWVKVGGWAGGLVGGPKGGRGAAR